MSKNNTLKLVLIEISLSLSRFDSINSSEKAVEFFRNIGYNFQPHNFQEALPVLKINTDKFYELANDLEDVGNQELVIIFEILVAFSNLISTIKSFPNQLQGVEDVPDANEFVKRFTDYLILEYIEEVNPELHESLFVVGLIENHPTVSSGRPMRKIHWDRIGDFLSKPSNISNEVYNWNTNFDSTEFLSRMEKLMRASLLSGGAYPQSEEVRSAIGNSSSNLQELRFPIFASGNTAETYKQFGITFSPVEAQGSRKAGIALLPHLTGTDDFPFNVCDRGSLEFSSAANIDSIGIVIRPPNSATKILDTSDPFNINLRIKEKNSQAEETIILGTTTGSRLSAKGLSVNWFVDDRGDQVDLGVEGSIESLKLVLGGGGDGFLNKILSGVKVEADTELSFSISLNAGFSLNAGAGLAIELPTHKKIGPLKIKSTRLELFPKNDSLKLRIGSVISAKLGPMSAVVENIGIKTELQFKNGNLGSTNLDIGFNPPNGVGLSLDVGMVKGGGYLFIDKDRGEYTGALELSLFGIVTVKAIGIINTRLPDGSKGFSLLIIISAEFGYGFQLGFGFTLLAVGGVLGLNRTMKLEAVSEGIKSGGIESVMFPPNVVENAPQIISDLKAFFPPEEGRFLIGPLAKIGWGTPTLISLSLGVIVEVPPGNIAILGILKIELPHEKAAIIKIQVNFLGVIEVDKRRIWFEAYLFESRVLTSTIEGGMGLLMAFGDNANFVISVGGFHPRFNAPSLPFKEPDRVAFNAVKIPLYEVRIEGYFALTTNTFQFGAKVEITLGIKKFGVHGHIAFDVLIQFSPFYFIFEFSASFSITVFGKGIFSVNVNASIEGPTPWKIYGKVSFKIFIFIKIKFTIDKTWGDKKDTSLPSVEVLPLLKLELENLNNWEAVFPQTGNQLVSLRKIEDEENLLIHPQGFLRISQKRVPLDLNLDKFGNQKISDGNRFSLETDSGDLKLKGNAREQFDIGHFREMDDNKKLTHRPFEYQNSGIELTVSGNQTTTSLAIKRSARYERIIIDSKNKKSVLKFFRVIPALFYHFIANSAITKLKISNYNKQQLKPNLGKIKVNEPKFVVVRNTNNQPYNGSSTEFESQASALDFMDSLIKADPNLGELLQVIPTHELNV